MVQLDVGKQVPLPLECLATFLAREGTAVVALIVVDGKVLLQGPRTKEHLAAQMADNVGHNVELKVLL